MTTPNQVLTKTCTKCGETKHEDHFYMRPQGYRQSQCKTCFIQRTHDNRLKRLDAARAHDAAYGKVKRAFIKEAVFKAYGGWQCACCGETEQLFLTLDHINNNGAEDRRAIGGKQTSAGYVTYRYLYARNFPPGYQVLCSNCQHGKRMNKGICPHQERRND